MIKCANHESYSMGEKIVVYGYADEDDLFEVGDEAVIGFSAFPVVEKVQSKRGWQFILSDKKRPLSREEQDEIFGRCPFHGRPS